MTREEAINKWVMPAIKNTWNENKCGEIIEALKQEPSEDAISRKSIMERLNNAKMFFEYEGADTFDKGRKNGLIDAIDIVADEPLVYPKPNTGYWIDEGVYADNSNIIAYRCSKCGGHVLEYPSEVNEHNLYCKWCGANMEETK